MKNLYYLLAILLFVGCKSDDSPLSAPSGVSNVSARADTGAVVLSWDLPADSSFLYLDISYDKYPNSPDTSKIIHTKASRHADSLVIDGLLHKYEYAFKIQPFNANPDDAVGGEVLTTDKVKPIKRPVEMVYYPDELTKIEGITADMIDTYTQEPSEGPKENLLDGDINTYWHSAWSSGVAPLPHWVEFAFQQEKSVGAFKYNLRQTPDTRGFPTQFALDISKDGNEWKRVWESDSDLPHSPVDKEFTLDAGKNYNSKHFRVIILTNAGGTSFTHLSELSLYTMKVQATDLEEQAEQNY